MISIRGLTRARRFETSDEAPDATADARGAMCEDFRAVRARVRD